MPRTEITVNEAAERYPTLPVSANALDFSFTAGDVANGNAYVATGREVVIFRNVNAGAQTFTLDSVADEQGRTGDITAYSLGAAEFAVLYPPLRGFQQSDGMIYIDVSHADVTIAVLRLPG